MENYCIVLENAWKIRHGRLLYCPGKLSGISGMEEYYIVLENSWKMKLLCGNPDRVRRRVFCTDAAKHWKPCRADGDKIARLPVFVY